MEAARTRFTFAGEWFTAAAFLAATVLVGVLVVRELRTMPRAAAAAPSAPSAAATTAVPSDAVSVPTLVVGGGAIQVGDRAADTIARLDRAVVLTRQVRETGPLGPRDVRSYELSGTRFILVLEPFERGGEPRVAAIYLE